VLAQEKQFQANMNTREYVCKAYEAASYMGAVPPYGFGGWPFGTTCFM
jgi:hypothetical protein